MMRRWLWAGLAPAVAAAALLLTPSTSQAWGWRHWGGGWGGWGGWGYGGWYSPYYSGYGFGWGGYPAYSSYGWTPMSYSYYSPSYYTPYYYTYSTPYYASSYPATATVNNSANRNDAQVRVEVPANAEVWFGGFKTTQTGTDRLFRSPPLKPKANYNYEVRARWMENGKVVDRTRNVPVHAGETATVDFMQRTAATPPANPRGETPTSIGP